MIVLLAAAMFIYDHARRDQIAKGVTIAGVNVGGLSEAAARAKIERELIARAEQARDRPLGLAALDARPRAAPA